jgi:hypothetical protein
MAGRGTISVNQSPQYGDKSALESASKAVTKTPMTGNPTPAPSAGRPPTGASQPQGAPQQAQPEPPLPDEHVSALDKVAQAYRTQQFWDAVLKNYPSEWSRMYAADARKALIAAQADARQSTPFFE